MSDVTEDSLRSVEDRLARVEVRIEEMDKRLSTQIVDLRQEMNVRFDGVHRPLDDINATMRTIAAKLPTWWQSPAAISGVMAVGATIYGLLSYLHLRGCILKQYTGES